MRIESLFWIVLYIYPGLTQSTAVDDSIPCERGWFYFDNKCYKLGGRKALERLNREQAAAKCISEGGKLVTIDSEELQDFLVAFLLLDAKESAWIGLHDRITESNYTWDDGSAVNYSNWKLDEPSGSKRPNEDCVEMAFVHYKRSYELGQWNDNLCSKRRAFICEAETSNMSSSDPRFCSSGGWKYLNICYHVVNDFKSWDNAEQHCQNMYNGHLITILDRGVDLFFQHILSKTYRDIWIGIKMQEKSLQQWESGWYVGYSKWGKNESEAFVPGTCALRSKHKSWKTDQCSKKYSFICETPSVGPPRLKQAVEGAKCPKLPEDWWDLGGEYCYFFNLDGKFNWYDARRQCSRRGGSLVSIHSEEESIILNKFIIYTQHSIHIGLYRLTAYENRFMWNDGSRLDYTKWNQNEPSKGNEMCVEMYTENMKWNDNVCNNWIGYICSVKKVSLNETQQIEQSDRKSSSSFTVLIVLSVCILLVAILAGCMIYYYRTQGFRFRSMSSAFNFIIFPSKR